MLEVSPVRAFRDNYIWLIHGRSERRRVAVVDPGDARPVIDYCRQQDLIPEVLLITHHHWDHTGGIADLQEQWPCTVYGPAGEDIHARDHGLVEGDRVKLESLGLEFAVIDIPGHTAGHIAFVGEGAVFCGDTLFSGGCGRLFEGSPAQMSASLDKMAALPEDTRVFCGHEYTLDNLRFALTVEPENADTLAYREQALAVREKDQPTLPSTIGLEQRINPFLRCRTDNVRSAAEKRAGRELTDTVEVFATIRQWKDGF